MCENSEAPSHFIRPSFKLPSSLQPSADSFSTPFRCPLSVPVVCSISSELVFVFRNSSVSVRLRIDMREASTRDRVCLLNASATDGEVHVGRWNL